MTTLAFDLETVPDTAAGRRLHDVADLDEHDVIRVLRQQRLQQTDGRSDFLKPHLHRVVAISVMLRTEDTLRLWSLGTADAPEEELIRRFFDGLEQYMPVLVSWNGHGFDLPVLHYRALLHGVASPTYWDTGDEVHSFRWNNYRNRFHQRHVDLMDVLASYDNRATASLHEIAALLGLPAKQAMNGSEVCDAYLAGGIDSIRNYCETDVLTTYLVYLRFQLMCGHYTAETLQHETDRVRELLRASEQPHLQSYLEAWPH